ncbi:MAG: site-2 protease family protein [Deltaproteobacteria bacterium]|jgi:Zn-dependent protease|nr:site-2 protease family protein [Deltaproteobacteria bacterium]
MFGISPETIRKVAILTPLLLLALTAHEFAHGWVAWKKGDWTAKNKGRLSFNPLVHIDPIGALVMLVTGFIGWAKPVPVEPRNFRDPARDMVSVALAGPAANLLLAIGFGLIFKVITLAAFYRHFADLISLDNLTLAINVSFTAILLNLGLAFFNLLPVPPLDGFRVAAYFMSPQVVRTIYRYQILIFILLLVAIRMGLFDRVYAFLTHAVISIV